MAEKHYNTEEEYNAWEKKCSFANIPQSDWVS